MEKGEDRLFTLEVIIRKENDKLKQVNVWWIRGT